MGGFYSYFITKSQCDLEIIKSLPNIVQHNKNIKNSIDNLTSANYFIQLQNYKYCCDKIIETINSQRIFYAAFNMQIELCSKLNKHRKYTNSIPARNNSSLQLVIKDLKPQANLEFYGDAISEDLVIPDNIKYEPGTFIDLHFISKGYGKECIWVRAKDILPSDYETVLLGQNICGDIQYF